MIKDFKGVWISEDLWFEEGLSKIEMLFLAVIISLDGDNGCYAGNEFFSKFFRISVTRVSLIIKSLQEKGYIQSVVNKKEGNKRIIKSLFNKSCIGSLTKVNEGIEENLNSLVNESCIGSLTKVKEYNILYNIYYNKIYNIENSYEFSFDDFQSSDDFFKFSKQEKLDIAFLIFWRKYPKKEVRKRAYKIFMQIPLKDLVRVFFCLDCYLEKWKIEKTLKKFIPNPDNWLKNNSLDSDLFVLTSSGEKKIVDILNFKKKKVAEDKNKIIDEEKIEADIIKINEYWDGLNLDEKNKILEEAKKKVLERYEAIDIEQIDSSMGKYVTEIEKNIIISDFLFNKN